MAKTQFLRSIQSQSAAEMIDSANYLSKVERLEEKDWIEEKYYNLTTPIITLHYTNHRGSSRQKKRSKNHKKSFKVFF